MGKMVVKLGPTCGEARVCFGMGQANHAHNEAHHVIIEERHQRLNVKGHRVKPIPHMPWAMQGSTMGNLYQQKYHLIIEGHQHFTVDKQQVKTHSKHALGHARLRNGQFIPTKISSHYRGTSTFYHQGASSKSPFQACRGPCEAPQWAIYTHKNIVSLSRDINILPSSNIK